MSTFTDKQQKAHRAAFIEECRQKAWSAACHADWISKGLDNVMAEYEKLQSQHELHTEKIKEYEAALDSHTKDNRDKRKALQERCGGLAKTMEQLRANMQQGQQALQGLYQNVESNLALAAHAEGWEWREVVSAAKANDTDSKTNGRT